MNTALLASLENVIGQWVLEQAENDGLSSEVYYPDTLAALMAKAASVVFDANEAGQLFAADQETE